MQTMAEAWIEEGKAIGLENGKKEGREEGREEGKAQKSRELILRLLQRRFQPGAETMQTLAQQLGQLQQEATLSQLVDVALDVLVLPDFMRKLQGLLPIIPAAGVAILRSE